MKKSKLAKNRDADVEIDQLKRKCMGLESQVATLFNHEFELGKELKAYKIKCEELQRNEMELENLRGVINGFVQEGHGYRIRCTEFEEKIKSLMEEQEIAMSERETRICHLEEVIKKMETEERERLTELETQLLKLQEENATLRSSQIGVSGECSNSSFTPNCKCSSLQLNSNGVHFSGDAPPANYQRDYLASEVGTRIVFETERQLTRFRRCSGTPSSATSENPALLKQDGGARPSTTCTAELVDISDDEGET